MIMMMIWRDMLLAEALVFTFCSSQLVVICTRHLGYLCHNLVVVWFCLLVAANWLSGKIVSKMTYNVSSGMLSDKHTQVPPLSSMSDSLNQHCSCKWCQWTTVHLVTYCTSQLFDSTFYKHFWTFILSLVVRPFSSTNHKLPQSTAVTSHKLRPVNVRLILRLNRIRQATKYKI